MHHVSGERIAAQAHTSDGCARLAESRLHEAVAAFHRALACDPACAAASSGLGNALLALGDVAAATTWFERAIECEPGNPHHYRSLVTVGQARVAPRYRETMLRLASEIDELAPAQQAELHFALGAVFERDGHHDAAFAHLRAANAITRASTVYDEAAELSFLRASQSAFASPVMDSLRDCGERSERPVFIFGLPRSGSTLVEQLLAAHPAVDTAGELGILGGIVRSVWDGLAASTLAGLRAGVRRIGERYLAETDSLAGGGTRLTDKTLYNVGFAPFIHVTLPNARMIHVRRNPLDTCISCYATLFAPLQVSYSYDLGELGRYYRASTEMIEAVRPFIAPDRLLEVVYEELIDDFEAQARRIVAFCGLLWDPACLNFHAVRRPVLTASSAQVRQPLYRDSLGRAAPFLPHLGPLVAALGGSS